MSNLTRFGVSIPQDLVQQFDELIEHHFGLNAADIEAAERMVTGTARSMGIRITE